MSCDQVMLKCMSSSYTGRENCSNSNSVNTSMQEVKEKKKKAVQRCRKEEVAQENCGSEDVPVQSWVGFFSLTPMIFVSFVLQMEPQIKLLPGCGSIYFGEDKLKTT